MLQRIAYFSGIAVAACLLGAVVSHEGRRHTPVSIWQEISWPFPRDAWPAGRAFRCAPPACGEGVELYVRPKIGFCNCTTGVADDDEVDRVTDLDLISERFTAVEMGQEIRIAALPGRARRYQLQMPDGTVRAAVGLAVARQCDVVVAVTQGKLTVSPDVQRAALDLLSSGPLTAWLGAALDGQ
jgi:hypothetical protein